MRSSRGCISRHDRARPAPGTARPARGRRRPTAATARWSPRPQAWARAAILGLPRRASHAPISPSSATTRSWALSNCTTRPAVDAGQHAVPEGVAQARSASRSSTSSRRTRTRRAPGACGPRSRLLEQRAGRGPLRGDRDEDARHRSAAPSPARISSPLRAHTCSIVGRRVSVEHVDQRLQAECGVAWRRPPRSAAAGGRSRCCSRWDPRRRSTRSVRASPGGGGGGRRPRCGFW